MTRAFVAATMATELQHEEPTRGKGFSRMARSKRQYGSGCLLRRGRGWAIRWREIEITPDGTRKKVLRYEALGEVTKKHASDTLAQKVVAAGNGKTPTRSRVTFGTLVNEWQVTVLPMYKQSTQKNHRHIVKKHLSHRFGGQAAFGRHATGDPGIRGSSHPIGIRAEVHRSYSRCAKRCPSYGCEVGSPAGESCARRRLADAEVRATKMGTDNDPGRRITRGVTAARADDGRSGAADGTTTSASCSRYVGKASI